jgi:hypothetical protein
MSNASNWASLTDDALENSPSDPAASAGAGNEGKPTDAVSVVMRQAYLQKRSAQSRQRPPPQYGQFLAGEIEKWGRVIRANGITADS